MTRAARTLAAVLFCLLAAHAVAADAVNSMQRRRTPRKPSAAPAPSPAATPKPQRPAGSLDTSAPARIPPDKTVDQAVEDALNDSINEALRKPAEGDTRARAVLTTIECGKKGMVFVFKDGDKLLRLTAPDFEGLHIMAFTPEARGEMTCGPRKKQTAAVVTFRPAPDARAKTDGALVAVEFVPASFKLKQ